MENDNSAFTNTQSQEQEKVTLGDIKKTVDQANKISESHFSLLAMTFAGIPCKIDEELTGMQYYICVSPELYKKMEEQAPAAFERG